MFCSSPGQYWRFNINRGFSAGDGFAEWKVLATFETSRFEKMTLLSILVSAVVGLGVTLLAIPFIVRVLAKGARFQRATEFHHRDGQPVPRLGGLALALAFVAIQFGVGTQAFAPGESRHDRWVILASSLAMFALGFWDDLKPLGAKRKLLGQILIAGSVCGLGIGIDNFKIPFTDHIIPLHGWGVLFTLAWLVGITNLINLVDGVDGLAGGISLMLMGLLAYQCHTPMLQLQAAGMAGALIGFLWFNFPPARIYLGDGGAYLLGFQVGLFSLVSSQKGTIVAALAAPMFVLGLPIVDVALAILRRGLRGLPVFRPDRRHLHHHLLNMGLSRRQVVLSIYGVTLVFLVMGFVAIWSQGRLIPVLLGALALILLLFAGKLRFSREWFAVGRIVGNSISMRHDVQYGLCLTRWLALEGQRCASLEGLWPDLVFVAQHLGFSGMKLTLADGARAWELQESAGRPAHYLRQEIHGGAFGVLELHALAAAELEPTPADAGRFAPRLADEKLFNLMGELLAEGWSNAAKGWVHNDRMPLKFSTLAPESHRKFTPQILPPPAADVGKQSSRH